MTAESEVFRALANDHRRALLDRLAAKDGLTLQALCVGLDLRRQTVSQHLAVLEAADLVVTTWHGRTKHHHLNTKPITVIADRWIRRFHQHRALALLDLQTTLEHPMTTNDFNYITWIETTAESLWEALTSPDFTSRYWGASLESDWKEGSQIAWTENGVTVTDKDMVVLKSDPPNRLSYTWHTMTEEFGECLGIDPEMIAAIAGESRSHVTFEILQVEEIAKLTVTHAGFDEGSALRNGISEGWPAILANLKTLLETGRIMPQPEAFG